LRLSEAAALNKEGKKDPIDGTELQVALNWLATTTPKPTWGGKYNNAFNETMDFLENSSVISEKMKRKKDEISKKVEDQTKNLKQTKKIIAIISICGLIAIFALIFAFKKTIEAQKQSKIAIQSKDSLNQQMLFVRDQLIKSEQISQNATRDSVKIKDAEVLLDSLKSKLNPADRIKLTGIQNKLNTEVNFIIDVFYLEETSTESKPNSQTIVALLRNVFPNYIIRLRLLSSQINASIGYGIKENLIRCEANEADVANKVLGVIKGKNIFSSQQPRLQIISYRTPNYISIFVRNN
jgi:hypothetical protein